MFQLLMSKAYGETTTFNTNFDFMTTVQKFRIYCDKTRTFLYCRPCGL